MLSNFRGGRIDFVDLAKGFCIVLVVFTHVNTYFSLPYFLEEALSIFRMPLYFFLSGLFFKSYEGFDGFLKRKVNKLLIPFLFFYLTTSVALPNFLHVVGYDVRNVDVLGWKSLWAFITPPHQQFPNAPIWFLICLFVDNLYFYILYIISNKAGKFKTHVLVVLSFLAGGFGYWLGTSHILLPMYLDTAMSALPFFCCGYVFNKHSRILYPNEKDKYLWVLIIVCFAYTAIFSGKVGYMGNTFEISPISVYGCGLAGTLSVIFLAKLIHRLPLFSYWGRYSIIILCTHNLVIQFLLIFIRKLPVSDWTMVLLTLAITLMSYMLIIPFCLRYLPYVTAQKNVIKV